MAVRRRVEILKVDGCVNTESVVSSVNRLVRELGVETEVREVNVADEEAARLLRFLGSPTVRVNGRDVEPGAEARTNYGLSCRLYRTEQGLVGAPSESWIRKALSPTPTPCP